MSTTTEANDSTDIIVQKVAAFIKRFVFLRNETHYLLIAVWVIQTYLSDCFDFAGYLFAHSPEPESGKTRLLETLNLLAHNSSGILISPSEAVLFRTARDCTQLLDEVDSWGLKIDLKGVLNAGFQKEGIIKRMEQKATGGHRVLDFPVYGPRALAGIGTRILDVTTKHRTFMIEMVRQTRDERREKLNRKAREEAATIKSELEAWVKKNRDAVKIHYEGFAFPYLDSFRDRTIDVSQPLAAIIEIAYAQTPELQQAQSALVDAISTTRKDQVTNPADRYLIEELMKLAQTEDPLIGNASELSERCNTPAEEMPTPWDVASTLRKYGFETKSHRMPGEASPKYRYILPIRKLEEIAERYGYKSDNLNEQKDAVAETVENASSSSV